MFCGCCNRFAFTLAEVLITLGVIGVVAGMTLPNLIHKAQDRAAISQLKKAYSVLNQAFRRAVDEYGPVDSWCDADNYRSGGDRAGVYGNDSQNFITIYFYAEFKSAGNL